MIDAPAVPGGRIRLSHLRVTRTHIRHLLGRADQIGVELPAGHPFSNEAFVASLMFAATVRIDPVVMASRMCSGVIFLRTAVFGA